ncbi:MAG: FecR family protein [Candidatus Pacebacteria bacterium]|jgi:hypothetical protein|nr:FecR family protein [Candidatus Paceibacterota bacterium]
MKKAFLVSLGLLAGLVVAGDCFAGSVSPMKGSKLASPEELGVKGEEATTSDAVAGENVATVSEVVGRVRVMQADGTWADVLPGATLPAGTEIETAKKSHAVITFADGSTLTIASASAFKLTPDLLSEGSDTFNRQIMLLRGKIWAKIIKLKTGNKRFEVRTPMEVLAVRGTDFIVDCDPSADVTKNFVNEGTVEIDNLHGQTTALNAGESADIYRDGQINQGQMATGDWDLLVSDIEGVPEEKAVGSETPQEPIGDLDRPLLLPRIGQFALVFLAGLSVFVVILWRKDK